MTTATAEARHDARRLTDDEVFDALEAPFDDSEVKSKPGARGMTLRYIEWETAKRRLDEVLGRANWDNKVQVIGDSAVCTLVLTLPSGRVVTRSAVGCCAHDDPTVRAKGSDSDSFKRVCARVGVGTYLYDGSADDPPPGQHDRGAARGNGRPAQQPQRQGGKPRHEWREHGYPPEGRGGNGDRPAKPRYHDDGNGHRDGGQPRTGRAFFAWLKEHEERHANGQGVYKHVDNWARGQSWAAKFSDWNFDQVKEAVEEAQRYLNGEIGDSYEDDGSGRGY